MCSVGRCTSQQFFLQEAKPLQCGEAAVYLPEIESLKETSLMHVGTPPILELAELSHAERFVQCFPHSLSQEMYSYLKRAIEFSIPSSFAALYCGTERVK